MDNDKKLSEELLKVDGINPAAISESERAAFSQMLDSQSKSKQSKPGHRPDIWRMIMKNRITKLAAAAVIIIVLLGLVPFNGTTALGKIANEVTTTLARLKAMVLGQELSEAEHVERQIDRSIKILTKSRIYSSPEISSLEKFLNEQNIHFTSANSGSAKYAVLPANKVTDLKKFLNSSSSKAISSPNVLTYAGGEAMLTTRDLDGQNGLGLAVTIQQADSGHLSLDFAFHNIEDGCQLDGIKLAHGQALLITGVKSNQNENSDELTTILVLPELQ